MRRLLLLAALATPVTLRGQERSSDEVLIMAAAVKYIQRMYAEGTPLTGPVPPEYRLTDFRLASDLHHYGMRPGIDPFPPSATLRKGPVQDAALVARLGAAVSLDTVALDRAEKACTPFYNTWAVGRTDTLTFCRFATTQGVLGAGLPAISGDTAIVPLPAWVNVRMRREPERIVEEMWEVTVVREGGVWRAVRHTRAPGWVS